MATAEYLKKPLLFRVYVTDHFGVIDTTFEGIQPTQNGNCIPPPAANFLVLVSNEDTIDMWWLEDKKVGLDTLESYYQQFEEWALPFRHQVFNVTKENRVNG